MRLQYEIDIEYAYPFTIVMDCSAMVGSAPLAVARFDVGSFARKMAEEASSTSGREGDVSLMNGGEYKNRFGSSYELSWLIVSTSWKQVWWSRHTKILGSAFKAADAKGRGYDQYAWHPEGGRCPGNKPASPHQDSPGTRRYRSDPPVRSTRAACAQPRVVCC